MHIAVCDDNIADRRQLERLLKRESEKKAAICGAFYTDSYGNSAILLANPMQYDIFFIDMCHSNSDDGAALARNLLEKGVRVPIVLCCSQIDYRQFSFSDNVCFLDKPIKTEELSDALDHAWTIKQSSSPMIELREEADTYYVSEPDILYAEAEGRMLNITLNDGRVIRLLSSAANFFFQLEESYPTFLFPNDKTVINARHIQSFGFHRVKMHDGAVFRVTGKCMDYAKQIYQKYHK